MRVVATETNLSSLEREESAALASGAEFHRVTSTDPEELAREIAGAKVVLVQFTPFTKGIIQALAPGATIIRYGVGFDNIDLVAARNAGVKVAHVPDYCVDEVADHTASLILTLLRRVMAADRSVRAGVWAPVATCQPLLPLSETTVGFVGFGRIARAVCDRLRAFRLRFVAADPYLDPAPAHSAGVESVSLETLLERSDVVTLHAPLTRETRRLLGRDNLRRMKPTAVVVNTARGDLVDLAALAEALHEGRIRGAALDVFDEEPLPADHPIRSAPNTILTPHIAWYSEGSVARLQTLVADEIRRALANEEPRCPVPFSTAPA